MATTIGHACKHFGTQQGMTSTKSRKNICLKPVVFNNVHCMDDTDNDII